MGLVAVSTSNATIVTISARQNSCWTEFCLVPVKLVGKCLLICTKIKPKLSMLGRMSWTRRPTLTGLCQSFYQFRFKFWHFFYCIRVLFGYEGQSNVLKLVSSGNGGLTELTDDLNSGKIQYAFVNITNNTTNLTKYLLINWQVSPTILGTSWLGYNDGRFIFRVKEFQLFVRELAPITYVIFRRFWLERI